ncbi:MAG TPA: zinc-ribbon domain-containing protein [Nitrososphaera sp.]|nr:zinc-ribbon domain-containing protein [Nitrososphaera sp.]
MMAEDTLAEKKLRGSGGYAVARINDEEQKKGNLGGPELFLAGIGRLEEERFVKYHCNKCEKDYEGSPSIVYDNPNEELGEGVTLVEKGEYKCRTCNATIAQYRKFETLAQPAAQVQEPPTMRQSEAADTTQAPSSADSDYVAIQSLVGMSAYDSEAMLIGKVEDIGLRRSGGSARITIKIGEREVSWDGISKIGDIVLLRAPAKSSSGGKCQSCGYQNESDALFCAECGTKL